MSIEYRYVRDSKPGADQGKLYGRAAPFNSKTVIGGEKYGFRESIKPGAFRKSIADGDIVLLDNHDMAKPLARTSAGTLALVESKKDGGGLDWDAHPANTTYANDAVENARAGNYGGCSFGFEVIKDSWTRGENGDLDERVLEEVRLHEISVCTFPAYGDTSVQARSREEASLEAAMESREKALGKLSERDSDATETSDDTETPETTEETAERATVLVSDLALTLDALRELITEEVRKVTKGTLDVGDATNKESDNDNDDDAVDNKDTVCPQCENDQYTKLECSRCGGVGMISEDSDNRENETSDDQSRTENDSESDDARNTDVEDANRKMRAAMRRIKMAR